MEQKKVIDIERLVDLLSAVDDVSVEEIKEALVGLKSIGSVDEYIHLFSETYNTCYKLFNTLLLASEVNTKLVDDYNENWFIGMLNNFSNTPKKEVETYLYFMHSNTSLLTKIGFSKDPYNRHRTLSSMENGLKICSTIKCTNKKTASKCERFLHDKYKLKRISGEWFNLTNEELEEAIQTGREFILNIFKDGE